MEVPTIDCKKLKLKIEPGTQPGKSVRLRGKGLPKRGGGSGDLFVRVEISLPRHLTDRQKELWEELSRLGG